MTACSLLQDVMLDQNQQPMVRHEAAEALGALGDVDSLEKLGSVVKNDPHVAVVQTAQLAIDRIKWAHSDAASKEKLQVSLYSSNRSSTTSPIGQGVRCSSPSKASERPERTTVHEIQSYV